MKPLIFICSARRFAQIFDLTEAVGFGRLDIPLGCQPPRGDVEANKENARNYSRFAFEQGGIPFAPHLLFTQFLNDDNPAERDAGLSLGLEMLARCDALWAFGTPTMGMAMEIQEAKRLGIPVCRFDTDCQEVTTCE